MRQIRSLALSYPHGFHEARHSHAGWDQLIFGSTGVLSVRSLTGAWTIPHQRAVWMPAGMAHELRATGFVSLQTLYLPEGAVDLGSECRVLAVSSLLRELIVRCVSLSPLQIEQDSVHAALATLLVDELEHATTEPFFLAWPRDPRALAMARLIEEQMASGASLQSMCRTAGASKRTMERLFWAETGMTLGAWKHQAAMLRAVALLSLRSTVTDVSYAVGYESPSAFIAAFRRTMGVSPRRFARFP